MYATRGATHFARLKVPTTLPRLISLEQTGLPSPDALRFVWLEDVIAGNLEALFPGNDVLEAYTFHVLRDADMEIQEDEAPDLLETIEQGLRQRQFGPVVRLAVDEAMPEEHGEPPDRRTWRCAADDVYPLAAPLGMSSLWSSGRLNRPDLQDAPFVPAVPPHAARPQDRRATSLRPSASRTSCCTIRTTPSRRCSISSRPPPSIRMCWRSSRPSTGSGSNAPVVQALLEAQRNGKQVAVLVELKARFDEESNIGWARALEAEGVHVVYGLVGLKTHSKITLVVRREPGGLRRYLHLATGNYNAVTAGIYTDLGLLTCDPMSWAPMPPSCSTP